MACITRGAGWNRQNLTGLAASVNRGLEGKSLNGLLINATIKIKTPKHNPGVWRAGGKLAYANQGGGVTELAAA